jgi:hypothetical protein
MDGVGLMTKDAAPMSLSARVDILDHAVTDLRASFRDHAQRTEAALTQVNGTLQSFMDNIRTKVGEVPRPLPIREILATAAVTTALLGSVATFANFWLTTSLAPDRQKIEVAYRAVEDSAVLRYRLKQLEAKVGIPHLD